MFTGACSKQSKTFGIPVSLIRHDLYDVSNMDIQIVSAFENLKVKYMFIRQKPRLVSAELYFAGHLTGRLTSLYFERCVIFSKDQGLAIDARVFF